MRPYMLFVLVLTAGPAYAVELNVPQSVRVKNTDGQCFWCCADTAARYSGIKPLVGIERRVATGDDDTGRNGAYPAAVKHWEAKLGVVARHNPHGNTDAGVRFIADNLKRNVPVVVEVSDWPTDPRLPLKPKLLSNEPVEDRRKRAKEYQDACKALGIDTSECWFNHAVLVVGLSDAVDDWSRFGVPDDRTLTVIDPNRPGVNVRRRLAWLRGTWLDGRATAFDPRDQR